MNTINRLPTWFRNRPTTERRIAVRLARARGTIQRIDYRRRVVWVIAQGRAWEFVLAEDCRLWFDGTPAILRCFHPLDPISVLFHEREGEYLARAVFAWEPEATAGQP